MAKKRVRANGDGSIYYDKARDHWYAAITQADGRREKWACADRDAARERLAKAIGEREDGLPPTSTRTTMEQFLSWWLRHSLRCRPTSLVTYEGIVNRELIPALGRIQLRNLKAEDVERMMSRRLAEGVSASRLNVVRGTLRQALAVAEKRELVRRNVAALVEPLRVVEREICALDVVECRAFLAQTRRERLYTLYLCAMALGLRQGELLGLRWADVDVDRRIISVRQQLQRVKLGSPPRLTPSLVELKTRRSRRTAHLPEMVAAALAEHRKLQLAERLIAGKRWIDRDLVFSTRHGAPLDAGNLRVHFAKMLDRAGIARRRFHDLRHSYASLLQAVGVHPFVAQDMLGHARAEMTRRYTHPNEGLMADAAARVDAALADVGEQR